MTALKRALSVFAALCLLGLAAVSCRPAASPAESSASHTAIQPKLTPKSLNRDGCEVRYLPAPSATALNDPFEITLDAMADAPADVDINTKACEDSFTVTRTVDAPDTQGERPFQQHISLLLEPQWHGTLTLPEIIVSFSFKDKPPVVIALPQQTVTVPEPTAAEQALPLDDTAPRTPYLPPFLSPSHHWLYIAGAVLILLAAAVIILLKKRRPHGKKSAAALPAIPPHRAALAQLEDLLAQKLIEQGQYTQFYTAISAILRDYIEARFNIRAPERTTEEFLEELRHSPDAFSPQHTALLNAFMTHTDLVKYARRTPTQSEIDQTIADTRSFIRETIPQTESAPERS